LYERVLQMPIGQVEHVVRPRYNQVPRNLIGSRMESVHVRLANRS
jgi:hypothetical protein